MSLTGALVARSTYSRNSYVNRVGSTMPSCLHSCSLRCTRYVRMHSLYRTYGHVEVRGVLIFASKITPGTMMATPSRRPRPTRKMNVASIGSCILLLAKIGLASAFVSSPTVLSLSSSSWSSSPSVLRLSSSEQQPVEAPPTTPDAPASKMVKNENVDPSTEWELDCYSRPVLVDGKKLWEVLITDSSGSFRVCETLASNK